MDIRLQILVDQLGVSKEMQDIGADEIVREALKSSMVHDTGIGFLIAAVLHVIKSNQSGAFAECGTWRGGCAWAMLETQRRFLGHIERPVYCLDSFAGLPAVTEKDGPLARQWQHDTQGEKFFDNCCASRQELESLLGQSQFTEGDFFIFEGWFDDTIPEVLKHLQSSPLALLRLDGDWYDSTLSCLNNLCPVVSHNGIVIIDDYYGWDGCARAVHDYLSRSDLPYRIKSLPYNFGAYLIKQAARPDFETF